jgi:hypothetical protein
MLYRLLILLYVLVLTCTGYAQQPSAGFSRTPVSQFEKILNQRNVQEHSNIQPAAYGMDQSYLELQDTSYIADKYTSQIDIGVFGGASGGYQIQKSSRPLGSVMLGVDASWHKENKWSATLGYTFNAAMPAQYLQTMADSLHIQPGVGFAVNDSKSANGNGLYHTHYTYGHVSYNASKFFHFELGKGKHFWGDGYRSLILSDVAAPYPYARITTKFWRIKYTNLWAQMRDINAAQMLRDARKKYVALHALSWNISKEFNWSIYEMVVWQDRDSNSHRTLDINYLNPIIFYRPVEYAQGSPDNVILGTSIRYKATPKCQLYGQFVIDELLLAKVRANNNWWANKFGGQIGVKAFDVFTPNFSIQSELNVVRPFTYTHGSPLQAWGHMNQPLAHPMGNNFIEWLLLMRYEWQKWTFTEEFTWAAYGRDTDIDGNGTIDNLGGNIFRSYRNPYRQYGNDNLQGLKSTFHFHQFTASRKIFKDDRFEAFASHIIRFEKNVQRTSFDNMLVVGIRATGLLEPQRDF